jgi:hypothetical protein
MPDNKTVMLEIFHAIEERDYQQFVQLCRPDATFQWPPSLPYGLTSEPNQDERADSGQLSVTPTWNQIWDPFQPTSKERSMDPRIVGTLEDSVVVLWHQRGVDGDGQRIDEEVLALYELKDAHLACAKMFYFDPVRVAGFLAVAT